MKYVDSKFTQTRIELDGNEFIRCRFEDVILVFSARAPVSMVNCTYGNNVAWAFEGPAALTLGFLSGLYHGAGEGGKKLVESTFDKIRHASTLSEEGVSAL
jgi:hypothetical protein